MLYSCLVINWVSVLSNSFWIIGLASLLAAFSYHYWLASQEKRRLREQLNSPGYLRLFWASLVLTGIGLAGTSQKIWEMIIWIIFTILSAVNTARVK